MDTNNVLGTITLTSPSAFDIERDRRAQLFLPIVSIILIVIFIIVFILLSRDDIWPPQTTQPCPSGFCANDIFSGDKTCPSGNNQVNFDPEFQDCNPPTGCQPGSRAPCLYFNPQLGTICPGDENYNNGVCPTGTSPQDCKCTSRIYCPDFATVYFELDSITTPGVQAPCTTLETFVQQSTWIDAANLPRNDLPISPGPVGSSSNFVCGVQQDQLPNVWPSSTCLRGKLTLAEQDGLYYCTNVPPSLNCPTGQIPVLQTNGTYTCQPDQAAEQFNV